MRKGMTSTSLAGATLTIDLAALRANYRLLAKKSGAAATGAAIKGEAYGLGLEPVARSLYDEGCNHFFVARPSEGEALRAILPKTNIYVLDGLYAGEAKYYLKHKLRPALTTIAQAREWAKHGKAAPCALHVDTGINRVGLPAEDFATIITDERLLPSLNVALLMSHLACSDARDHKMNKAQWLRFGALRNVLRHVPASFANSSGIFLGAGYAFDVTRPGIALYGGNPTPHTTNPMQPVVHLNARILQQRQINKGETVGYSATWTAKRDTVVAVLGAGYRDGIPRKLSSSKQNGPAQVAIAGTRCSIIGRVSMDMTCVDVTDLSPQKRNAATHAEFFGKHISVDEAAGIAGTISYELLTHLGNRYARVYSS
jgi:alanine racemase